jgi:hypothetical protein
MIVERMGSLSDAVNIPISRTSLYQPLFLISAIQNNRKIFHSKEFLTTHNTKQPDKLPQQRIPHWPLNATAWVGTGRKARKT